MNPRPSNVFVVGLDDFNRQKLDLLAREGDYAFHPLLSIEALTPRRGFSLDDRLDEAIHTIEASPRPADAIVGYWDFPVPSIAALLCRRFDLPGPSLESVLRCEHKYWSRLEQQKAAPEHTPRFEPVDLFDEEAVERISLPFPFWLKPVKSYSSHLGFRVRNRTDLRRAVPRIRAGIRDLGEPFNQVLARARLPDEVAAVDGLHCVAEALVWGYQCTLEGFVHRGEAEVYGIVDSIRQPNRSSFARYEYPSRLPRGVKERMCTIARRVVSRLELNDTAFNMELFWNATRDQIWILEINPRISQSHGDLFEKVDGVPNHKVAVELALGRRPVWRERTGAHRRAGKFFLRRRDDAQVTRTPRREEVGRLEKTAPGALLEVPVRPGMRLSELEAQDQDSYGFVYAKLSLGASSRRELLHRYRSAVETLRFDFAPLPVENPPGNGRSLPRPPNGGTGEDAERGTRNVFLIGLNDFNRAKLERVSSADECTFHGLLEEPHDYDLPRHLEEADAHLRAFRGQIDAIVGYMDFPVSTMLPILCRRFGVRSPSLESVLRCEHKYWSRLEQREAIPECVPDFALVDPFDDTSIAEIPLPYPFWIKPVKSAASYLGFRIRNRRDLRRAIEEIRGGIGQIADPFDFVLRQAELPPEIEGVHGRHCIVEEIISGRGSTLEGWVHGGEVGHHGIVDSIRERNRSSFARYEYPTTLPRRVQHQMVEAGRRILEHMEFDDSGFNMEFQWEGGRDRLRLQEVNTRVAQHHSDLFEKVDGRTNHEAAIQVALGHKPEMPHREGEFARAATFFLRRYGDAKVEQVPDPGTIAALEERFPGTSIQLQVRPGMRLSELFEQDSYSYYLAIIYIGARNRKELLDRYRGCVANLHFEFSP